MNLLPILLAAATALLSSASHAASFDCTKARRPLEKLICAHPELDAADTRMGEVFRRVHRGSPLPGFVMLTQRLFLEGYPYCMDKRSSTDAVRNCVASVRERTDELETIGRARLYSDANPPYTHDQLIVLLYTVDGRNMIRLWGNWMPHMIEAKPFPSGSWCDITDTLKPAAGGGWRTDTTGDTIFRISDASISISGHVTCTPRTGIGEGTYRRVR